MKVKPKPETLVKLRQLVEMLYDLKISVEKPYANDPLYRDCNLPEIVRSVNEMHDYMKFVLAKAEEDSK